MTTTTTNNNLQIFSHPDFKQVRVITDEQGQPWFVAKDVCNVLDLSGTNKALLSLDEDEKREHEQYSCSGRKPIIINESGLYSLVLRSRKSEAKAFKRWITHEVLPSIRKHGLYATPKTVDALLADPDTAIQMLTAFKHEQVARREAEALLAEATPKVQLVDATFAKRHDHTLKLSEVARKLDGVNIQRIKRDLADSGILYKTTTQYRVYAKYRDSHFVEKFNPFSGKQDIYATVKGAALLAQMHEQRSLTMKTKAA